MSTRKTHNANEGTADTYPPDTTRKLAVILHHTQMAHRQDGLCMRERPTCTAKRPSVNFFPPLARFRAPTLVAPWRQCILSALLPSPTSSPLCLHPVHTSKTRRLPPHHLCPLPSPERSTMRVRSLCLNLRHLTRLCKSCEVPGRPPSRSLLCPRPCRPGAKLQEYMPTAHVLPLQLACKITQSHTKILSCAPTRVASRSHSDRYQLSVPMRLQEDGDWYQSSVPQRLQEDGIGENSIHASLITCRRGATL